MMLSAPPDTLTTQKAEQMMMDRFPQWMAAGLRRVQAEAALEQAARWDNPEVSVLYNIYNPLTSTWLDPSRQGELDVTVSQPLPLGRKRRVAESRYMAEAARTEEQWHRRWMLYELRVVIADVYRWQQKVRLLDDELALVDRVLETWQNVPQAVAQSEVRRIETLRLSLLAEHSTWQGEWKRSRMQLAVMTGSEDDDFVVIPDDVWQDFSSRPDLEATEMRVRAAEAEVRVQQAEGWPAVAVTFEYDRNGNICHNFFGAGVSVTLPVWNRNRGGIRGALAVSEEMQLERQRSFREAESNLRQAAERCRRAQQMAEAEAAVDATAMRQAAERQYLSHGITLLEFLDYIAASREAATLAIEADHELRVATLERQILSGFSK